MFTGIIEDIGRVTAMTGRRLDVSTRLGDINAGDSVAVNGVCLTVTGIRPDPAGGSVLFFDFSPETAGRTTTGGLVPGVTVNLERALKAGRRFGGHFMSGHVEGTGTVIGIRRQGNSTIFSFSLSGALRPYIVAKGSVGIDGVSLTVVEARERSFTISVIPHTLATTTLRRKRTGDGVNIEPDLLAKYVGNIVNTREAKRGITPEFLKENGF